MPIYESNSITDALYKICGFETDYEFITKRKMKEIQKLSKQPPINRKNFVDLLYGKKRLYSKTKKHCSESYVKQAFQRCFAQFYCQRWDYTISLHILQQYKAKGTGKKPFYLSPWF